MRNNFIHLHIHSEYSLQDGLIRINQLVEKTVADQVPAVALTEQGNLFSAVKFYCMAQKAGLKPIIGAELRLNDGKSDETASRLVLLCQNYHGYKNLNKIISQSYREGQHRGLPFIDKSRLKGLTTGLLALSGAQYGDIGQALMAGNNEQAADLLNHWNGIFPGRFYLELQRTGHPDEEYYISAAVDLANNTGIPVVATNNVRFLAPEDFKIHEARICIQQGYTLKDSKRPRRYTDKQYLRSSAEMIELFPDLPQAIKNTLAIAKRCNLEFNLGDNHLPAFPVPQGFNQDQWLEHQAQQGLNKLITADDEELDELKKTYEERLESELGVITDMGFSGYFLIVADFVKWAKENHIPVGPGRGSGAGSLVAYALGITDIDPLRYDLLFERFLNPERVSLPDFDIDFCMERRDEVISYVASKYGRENVSQIITYGRMAAKAVVRDVGRVLGYPYGFVDQIAKLIPRDLNITLDEALKEEALNRRCQEEQEVSDLIDLSKKLEGISRNAGRHAGGIIISPQPLMHYMPLYYEQDSNAPVSQFDMDDVEAMGLVKFDFLGLKTLTVIDETVAAVNRVNQQRQRPLIDIKTLPLDDEASYQLIRSNKTTAIFQLESDGMKKLIQRLQPNNFGDLVALLALFRPGPLQSGMVDDFINCKNGKVPVKYPYPGLEHILEPTNGVILYQEQVMQIAQILAGYTLGEADLLRRAMGKKKPEEMSKQRQKFTKGAVANGVNAATAKKIFDVMEKFAGYGFNKSHSVAYALISYQTAWLKAHYPAYFMATALSSEMDNTDKMIVLIDEVKEMKINLEPPSVNHSHYKFTVENEASIRFGLGAIKGIGEAAAKSVTDTREADGQFTDIFDLCCRVGMKKLNNRALKSIIYASAADELGPSRGVIYASLKDAIQLAEQQNRNSDSGQNDFFGLPALIDDNTTGNGPVYAELPDWTDDERLHYEKEALGFYLQGHPFKKYKAELDSLINIKLRDIEIGQQVCVAGYIHKLAVRSGIRGKAANIVLDDCNARANVTVLPEIFKKYSGRLFRDQLIIIDGKVEEDNFFVSGVSINAGKIYTLDQIRERAKLCLRLYKQNCSTIDIQYLKEILTQYCRGASSIRVEYSNEAGRCILELGEDWKVQIVDDLLGILRNRFGKDNVGLEYYR